MAIDLFSTRALLPVVEQMPREYSYLFDTFATDRGCVEDDKAIYDYRKGSRRMAPVVTPGAGGVVMLRDGFDVREIGFCQIAPERIIENNDLRGRSFGENVLGALTPQDRERRMIARDLTEMKRAIQRRREWMARQVLLTGKMEVFRYTNEGRDKQTTLYADYGFTHNFTPTTKWNAAGSRIDDDMKAIFDLVYEGGGYVDVIVMDPKAASAMLHNTDYIDLHDKHNVNIGEMNQRYAGQGVRFLGVNADGVEMYSLSGTFVDDDGTTKPMLPVGTVIAGSKGMLNVFHGPVTQVEEPGPNAVHKTYIKKEVPLRIGSVDGNAIKNRLTSCPTIVPANIDGWVVSNVL